MQRIQDEEKLTTLGDAFTRMSLASFEFNSSKIFLYNSFSTAFDSSDIFSGKSVILLCV